MHIHPPHPYLASELAREKQRDLIAADLRLSPDRRTRDLTRVSRKPAWVNWLLPRRPKGRSTTVLALDPVPTRSEPEAATANSSR
jgi:hypothetical protein